MIEKLKKPADYPQLYVRIDESSKLEIEALVEEILIISNSRRMADEKVLKRNDVIKKCLLKGLRTQLKELEKL